MFCLYISRKVCAVSIDGEKRGLEKREKFIEKSERASSSQELARACAGPERWARDSRSVTYGGSGGIASLTVVPADPRTRFATRRIGKLQGETCADVGGGSGRRKRQCFCIRRTHDKKTSQASTGDVSGDPAEEQRMHYAHAGPMGARGRVSVCHAIGGPSRVSLETDTGGLRRVHGGV